MNTPLITRRQQRRRASGGLWLRTWLRVLLLAVIVLLNLACMTFTTSWTVVHQEGQEDQVSVTLSRHLTEAYIEAARRANAERAVDYQEAGQDAADIFPDSMEEARDWLMADVEDLQNEGYQIVEDDRGFTAEADFALPEFQEAHGEESTVRLQVDEDRPEGIAYIFEVDLPESTVDLEELDQLRQDWPLPKPPLDPVDTDQVEEGSIIGGITAIFDTTGLEPTELDNWYAQGVLVEAGLPVLEYTVELPGRITVREVDGAEAGQVEGSQVTLVLDEAFWREFGPSEHLFRVESLLSVCEETCTEPHMIWDGVSEYPVCSCICEKGWEMAANGERCVDCQALCQQQDPPVEYDPENSEANRCACRPLPDRDGDGVPDGRDVCPDKPAATEDGCPASAPALTPGGVVTGTQGGEIDWSFLEELIQVAQLPVEGPTPGQTVAGAGALVVLMFFWFAVSEVDRIRRTAQMASPAQPGQQAAQPARPAAQPGQPPPHPGQPPAQPGQPPAQPCQPPAQPGQPPVQPAQQMAGPGQEAGDQQAAGQQPSGQARDRMSEEEELDRFFEGFGDSGGRDSGGGAGQDADGGGQGFEFEPEPGQDAGGAESSAEADRGSLTAEEAARLKEELVEARESQGELNRRIDELLDGLETEEEPDGGLMIDEDAGSAIEDL